jgi:hypothetical protein
MKIFRIEKIKIQPMIILAHSHDDAKNIFAYSLYHGLGNRPDADFDILRWRPKDIGPASPLLDWAQQGLRGIAWSVDEGLGWELISTQMEEP